MHPAVFRRQMKWLERHGYRTVTQRQLFDSLICGRRLGRKPVLVTFDDGYRDAHTKASPILARLGMRATAYVITGRISGDDPSFLKWRHLRKLERRGVEIGSHTRSHHALTGLPSRQAFAELVRSRRALERRLDHRVPWLAYPIGAYDPRIERLAPVGPLDHAGALLTLAIGTALQFWPFPRGSYAAEATRFAAPVPSAGGALRAMASLVLTAGLLLFAWLLVRGRALAWWSGVALAISGPAAFFLTPVLRVTGLAWIVVGVDLGRSRRRAAVPPEPSSAPS